ncbi:hypothetical protein [Novosphingobium tardum]
MKLVLVATSALALIAVPAQAQLLGGGGSIGGSLGGMLNGSIRQSLPVPSTTSLPTSTTASGARDGGNASGSAKGSARADRRSGAVEVNGSGSGSIAVGATGALVTPAGTPSGNGSAAASGSGNGSASAQLVGTDAVQSVAGAVYGQGRAAGQATVQLGRSAAASLVGAAGTLTSGVQGSAGGAASLTSGLLATSGSLAAQEQGAFTVDKGTPIFDAAGDKIGSVRGVVADAQGQIQQLLVRVDGEHALLPSGNFQVSGEALISAMGESQIKHMADQQDHPR